MKNLDGGISKVLALVPQLSEDEWIARDAAVAAERNRQTEASKGAAAAAKRAELEAAGFPLRALRVAEVAEKNETIARIETWDRALASGGRCVLVLAGAPGCGKTVSATRWALGRARVPRFLRAASFAAQSRYDDAKRDLLASPAIVLDDLGAEYADAKGSFLTDLDELVDTFYGNEKPLVITTNVESREQFASRYGLRIFDRLRECALWLEVGASSRRARP